MGQPSPGDQARRPWPLTRSDLDLFGLDPVAVTRIPEPGHPELGTWQAEFTRPG